MKAARNPFRSILVAIEFPHDRQQPALKRAVELARRTGAKLILFHGAYDPYATGTGADRPTMERRVGQCLADRRAALEKLAAPWRKEGLRISVNTAWSYPAADGIVHEVSRSKCNLVIAGSRRHRFGARLFLAPTDWELLRLCPVPLLLVRRTAPYGKTRVLAAIDPLHAHAKPARLEARILDASQALATASSGTLDVVHAWQPLSLLMPGIYGPAMATGIDPATEAQHLKFVKRSLKRSVARIELPPRRLHLESGAPESVLPALARRLRADVVVMGAVSRHGLDRLFIGSTAERTIDHLPCDVLVVKPRQIAPGATGSSTRR
jgi:universal stress protein E